MGTVLIALGCLAFILVLYHRYRQRRILKKIQKELLELLDEQEEDNDDE
jgi:hypothetical protein